MKLKCFLTLIISFVTLTSCNMKEYILNMDYENSIITDSGSPFESESINSLCNYDLSDELVKLENETGVDNLLFEEIDSNFFINNENKIFKLRLTCGTEKTIFYYIIDEDNDGLLTETFDSQSPQETYLKYSSEMLYLYDLEAIQNYSTSKLSYTLKTIEMKEEHTRLQFFHDMVRGIGYQCDVSNTGMICSKVVYSVTSGVNDPAREHTFEEITIHIEYGKPVRDALVTYYQYDGCHEDATECVKNSFEKTTEFLVQDWSNYIDISRDPRDERSDSRDFYQSATSVLSDYSQID